jgi:hypothetical protein
MKVYELCIRETGNITEEGAELSRDQWEDEFKLFFKALNERYLNFKLESFFQIINEGKITIVSVFDFTPEDGWDMSEVFDSTEYFYNELCGNENSVGRLIGNSSGTNEVYEVEEYLQYSEMPPIFHERYVLGIR